MENQSEFKYDEEFISNSRRMKLLTSRWMPENKEPKAIVCICHGYAMECSITMSSSAIRLAKAGFAVYGIDYEGHGKSEGLKGFIRSFDNLVDDCCNHFTSICEKQENKEKKRFLLGESMGGAVALLLHRKNPDYWDGAVLVAPMCKIVEERRPSPTLINLLITLSKIVPTWRLIPTKDIVDVAFKVPQVRKEIRSNPYCYKGRPRLRTGYELFRISLDLEQRLQEVSLPFLVLHGGDDKVTDKSVSKQLYDVASSPDKTIKLYTGMWHGLLYGEPQENIKVVFSDIISWLEERSHYANSRIEKKQKELNDDVVKDI